MKRFMRFLAAAGLVLLGLCVTSCGKDDNGGGTPEQLVGKWKATMLYDNTDGYKEEYDDNEGDVFQFNADGTGESWKFDRPNSTRDSWRWTMNGSKLTISYDYDYTEVWDIKTLNAKQLVLYSPSERFTAYLKRID